MSDKEGLDGIIDDLEEKNKLERRMNKDLHKLVKFLQENPRLVQDKFGEPVSLVAISAMELLQEEKRLVGEECERYKKIFSKEKGKSIALYIENERLEQALEFGIKYLQASNIGQIQLVVQAMEEALGE